MITALMQTNFKKTGIGIIKKLLIPFLMSLLFCSSDDDIIKVQIKHNRSNPHSLNDEFVCSNKTHILLKITDRPPMDAPSTTIYLFNYDKISSLPFAIDLSKENDLPLLEHNSKYLISASILQGLDSNVCVGDLMSEYSNEFSIDIENIIIEVFGTEHCDSSNAGGFCTSIYRE